MSPLQLFGKVLKYGVLALLILVFAGLAWLRWDAGQERDEWFAARRGVLQEVQVTVSAATPGQRSEEISLVSTSGLRVNARSIRDGDAAGPRPVFLVLGGHRTGRNSVELFGRVQGFAVVGVEYPYDGPDKVRGAAQTIGALPLARRAILDTVPAVQLVVDWLVQQSWAAPDAIILVGASLGVPFAAASAAQESRIAGVILAHGAAELRPWLEAQVARRIEARPTHYPLSVVLYWLSYGRIFDPGLHVGSIAPRPLVVIGAREDERTPPGQVERLFALAGEPKRLRYTQGMHVEPDRPDIVAELLQIAEDELHFLTSASN
jgi:dienelactone hydrolase